ncbi:MAG: DMT family transporter [Salinivirgaceae bacterium]|nr:DMT family transporter [Salinivirgaceae bacterium]
MNKGIYFASFTALLWGFLAIALKVSLNYLPPVSVTWFRFSIAFVSLFLYYLIFDKAKIKIIAKPPKLALLAALFLGFNYLGFISGINLTSPSISQVFIQVGPVLLAVSGFVIFKEKASFRQIIGLMVVVLGLFIFYNEQIVKIAGGLKEYKLGVLLIMLGGLSWVGYAVSNKIAVKKFNPMQLNLIIFGLPALLLIPFVSFEKFQALSIGDWLLLIFLGLNTLGAYGSLSYAFKYLEANKISVIITLNPLITFAIMAWLSTKQVSWIEAETLTIISILGAFTVLSGVILTVLKKKTITPVK